MNLLWKGFAFWKIFVYFALANWKQFAIRIIPLWKHFEWLREYSRSHFVFIQGASERCCRMAHVLLGQSCCSFIIYEKAIVQIIIRADLVLIAPIDILYVCIKRKDTVVHIVRIRSFLILQQTLFGREMLLIMFRVPSETMFYGIKPEKSRRRFLPYSYRFLPLPCCRPKNVEFFFRAQSVVF